jgi:hypothetical protein
MPINVTLSVQVVEGPSLAAFRTINVDAYDKIQVTIAPGAGKVVEVQPGPAGRVQLLVITSSEFGDLLTYKVNNTGSDVKLDGEQIFIGDGAVGLLGADPQTLAFTNGLANDVDVAILVGRNAAV